MPGGINSSGINSSGISEGGVSNNTPGMSESTNGFSNIAEAPAQVQLALPDPISQEIQQPYILNGLTYQSNNPYIIERDGAGNIKLQESASNQRLIIEPSIEHITNQSFVQVVNTQFKYFKFPAKVNITGTEGLDIDLPSFRYDEYEGRLLKDGDTLWFIKDNLKRLFYIKADSTWAIKNQLPPFANIAGDIGGKEKGEDNWFSTTDGIETGYNNKTYTITAPSVIASYKEGPAYTWLDAFPDGEDRYSKFHYNVTNFDSLGGTNIYINGRDFSSAEFSVTALGNHNSTDTRFSEFNTDDTKDSYLGFNVQTPSGFEDTWVLKDTDDIHIYKQDSTTDDDWNYYVAYTFIKNERVGGTHMTLKMDVDGVDHNMTPFLVDRAGIKSGTPVVTFPAPGGGDYGGWVLRIPELIERLKHNNPNKIITLSNGNEQIKGNVGIRFNLQFPETNQNNEQTRQLFFEYRISKDEHVRTKELVGDFHTSLYGGNSNRTYSATDVTWNSGNDAGGWGWYDIIGPINTKLASYSV
jgi:hypothetical protein